MKNTPIAHWDPAVSSYQTKWVLGRKTNCNWSTSGQLPSRIEVSRRVIAFFTTNPTSWESIDLPATLMADIRQRIESPCNESTPSIGVVKNASGNTKIFSHDVRKYRLAIDIFHCRRTSSTNLPPTAGSFIAQLESQRCWHCNLTLGKLGFWFTVGTGPRTSDLGES